MMNWLGHLRCPCRRTQPQPPPGRRLPRRLRLRLRLLLRLMRPPLLLSQIALQLPLLLPPPKAPRQRLLHQRPEPPPPLLLLRGASFPPLVLLMLLLLVVVLLLLAVPLRRLRLRVLQRLARVLPRRRPTPMARRLRSLLRLLRMRRRRRCLLRALLHAVSRWWPVSTTWCSPALTCAPSWVAATRRGGRASSRLCLLLSRGRWARPSTPRFTSWRCSSTMAQSVAPLLSSPLGSQRCSRSCSRPPRSSWPPRSATASRVTWSLLPACSRWTH
mmetsp:Transcript_11797/g.27075  ORF Transcript_11797/g.27075 Transcript_11797/m.27075 type:complete len:273 (+) Transcript_11797:565-1383(+)